MEKLNLKVVQACASALLLVVNSEINATCKEEQATQAQNALTLICATVQELATAEKVASPFAGAPTQAEPPQKKLLQEEKNEENNRILKFTEKEVSKLPMNFRKHFKINNYYVSARKRIRGKNSYSIEIRYRHEKDGYNISASGRTVEEAKAKFIEKVNLMELNIANSKIPTTFEKFAMYYFENFKKRKVAPQTYKNDLQRIYRHIIPVFGDIHLKSITALQCQNFIDQFVDAGKGKTAEELRSLLNQIFKMAVKHGILKTNPIDITFHQKHERQHGSALTVEEEKILLNSTAGTPYQLMFAVALYTGLRPNEYQTARIDGDFIVAVNSKRKNGKVEYKKIPITPMLRPYLDGVTKLEMYTAKAIRVRFNKILPNHIMYDLRTTFYTRCRMCGIADAARDEFVGHSSGVLSDTYTDLPDAYLLKEGSKFKY